MLSTLNVQHLESLNDVVERITGVPQRETVPDSVVRAAEQVQLVDMTPEALRRRMAHGNIYPPEKIDAALGNYFRPGNLTALRELALLWLADRVEEGMQRYREQHGITGTWETRERVVVALTGGPEGDALIRRAARIAARSAGGDLLAVHVSRSDGVAGVGPAGLESQRLLVESLGRQLPLDRRRGHPARDPRLRAQRRRHPDRARRLAPAAVGGRSPGPAPGRPSPGCPGRSTCTSSATTTPAAACSCPRLGYGLTARRRLTGLGVAIALLGGGHRRYWSPCAATSGSRPTSRCTC